MDNAPLQGGGSKKPTTTRDLCAEAFCGSILGIVFAVLFGLYTSDPSYYNGKHCGNLWTWGRYLYYFFIVSTISSLIITPLIYCCVQSNPTASTLSQALSIRKCINSIMGIAGSTGYIGLCVAYSQYEPCGELSKLALGYIIFVASALGFACLCMCCVCCMTMCVGASALAGINNIKAMELQQPLQV